MNYKVCFIAHQYLYGGEEGDSELLRYCRRHGITVKKGELLLAGRLCEGIKRGDTLFMADKTPLPVKGLSAYGRTFEELEAGMTCAILTDRVDHPFYQGDLLYR